ncbi:MAG TPA: dehydrogenase, partial [Verrucomicrobiales bacterium]|nr:dehydrogenase [Verrucomicrobiales bacterium]
MNSPFHPCAALALASLLTSSTFAANPAGHGPEAAREQLKRLQVADGLEVRLFASEPMIRNPISMDIDARGRVWVTEGANYRLFQKWGKLVPEGDRILILEDADGDGAADSAKVFYQGNDVNSALGICVLGPRVIVSCSPNILVFEDRNGDDRADGPPTVLFSGIGGVDHDHGAHAFHFGPDGKLYFNIGNDGRQLKTADGREFIVDRAGNPVNGDRKPYQQGLIFRCNLDGSQVETLGWNFRNNFEVAVDSFGTIWQSDNDDDGNRGVRINYVMEFGNYGYKDEKTGASWNQKRTNMEKEVPLQHWHLNDPGVVPNLLQTGAGSPTGITIYEGSLLPEVFRNQMIHCDAGPRTVRAYPVQPDGAGYSATVTNLLTSEDPWYRPSDVTVAPDGAVYISDWNDAGVGGHFMADQKVGEMTGRIYRVAPTGHKSSVPKVELASAKGAVAALQSPNEATRYLAWTALHAMGGKAEEELQRLWNGADARQRARALHLLARIPGREAAYVEAALTDANSDLRITGLRIARERSFDLIPLIRQLVD